MESGNQIQEVDDHALIMRSCIFQGFVVGERDMRPSGGVRIGVHRRVK